MTPAPHKRTAAAQAVRQLRDLVAPPVVALYCNPLGRADARTVAIGTPLRELAPATQSPLLLRVNGAWLLRAEWHRPALPGDVIEWHVMPQGGGNASRAILTIAVIVASVYTGGAVSAAYGQLAGSLAAAGVSAVGMLLVNALVPIQQPNLGANATSPASVYTVALAANQARPSQPIPEIFGRLQVFPDFAGQPYSEYVGNDQYYRAVFCIGQGWYTFERLQIDDTPLQQFQDVLTARQLNPGELPSAVLANVVTAPEVVGQELTSGRFVGAYAACSGKFAAASIGVDIIFPRGLGLADGSGVIGSLSAQFRADAQYIDDFGVPTSAWFALGPIETITASTSTPQRRSFRYTLATPGRVQIRVGRMDVKNENVRALHEMQWGGLRAYLTATPELDAGATHLEIVMRASEQLSGLSQRKVSAIVRRKLHTWSSADGWSADPVETRNAAWALAYLWTSENGANQPDSRVDLAGLEALAATLDTRQDRFDMLFDGKVTTRDAARTIAQSCRSMPFERNGVYTVSRDELQTLPVTAFTSRSLLPGSMSIGYALATEATPDGVIVEYFDNRAWDWRPILCRAPGVTSPTKAVRIRVNGITGAKHAEREGLYMAATNVYRRKFPKFQTEMLGLLPAFGSLAIFAPALPGWGQAGDVAFWDPNTLTMGLTEPVAFTVGAPAHYVSLQRDDGSMTDAIAVTPGPTAYDVVLASAPDFELVLDDATRERPKYVFGAEGEHRVMVRTLGITKRGRGSDGAPVVEISTVAENGLVHAVDNHLLPGPGEIQDPVDSAEIPVDDGGSGSGSYAIVYLQGGTYLDGEGLAGGGTSLQLVLEPDGSARMVGGLFGVLEPALTGQWSGVAISPTIAAGYEVRFTDVNGAGNFHGAALGTWLDLGTTRDIGIDVANGDVSDRIVYPLRVEIRELGSTVVQASAIFNLIIWITGDGSTGA